MRMYLVTLLKITPRNYTTHLASSFSDPDFFLARIITENVHGAVLSPILLQSQLQIRANHGCIQMNDWGQMCSPFAAASNSILLVIKEDKDETLQSSHKNDHTISREGWEAIAPERVLLGARDGLGKA